MLNLDYANLIKIVQPYKVVGREENSAFLSWFLVNLYRLDIIAVQNIVCDGRGDKGIDGIYVNENEECIDVFQSKTVQNSSKTLGDTQLKEFVGSLRQLETADGIDSIISTTGNTQLKNLLIDYRDIFISSKYIIRGMFVTNANKDSNAESFLQSTSATTNLEVWDRDLIAQMYINSEKSIPATSEIAFDVFGFDYIDYNVDNIARVVLAPLSAVDLVNMEGIHNQQLFDLNLRKDLGKTKVNKDITNSISNSSEHSNFILYHNGITIICDKLDTLEKDKIKIQGYSVVNGCQTVSSLYENRARVTQDLRILTRIIQVVQNQVDLISKITYNSNNQNGIKARDFRSNTPTQVRLQQEVAHNYPGYFYEIKRGDNPNQSIVIENTLAGQILLSFDLKRPWAVQNFNKIFDDSHQEIFARPEVTGGRIVVLFDLYKEIEKDLCKIEPPLFRSYQVTKFFLLYLLSEVMADNEVGKDFCRKPEKYYKTANHKANLLECIHVILGDLIIDLNGEFEEEGGENFDFKSTFKAPNLLRNLTNKVINSHKKLIARGRVESFSQLWEKLANQEQQKT
ncbi:Abortive phage infection protein [Crinalium epipsammum PCC 9333]|uniref:Abortive phage infection protein n=1 Tax=Crinalium epipsammum PCC 9333 TaxID=1173022 RepID=K9VZS1_9CYAN|nr:AIPR family protein [Crinalium epipsammum]AFZ13481.1 Abortive phage infection protein [Crinalium epipsammum PCC 9333]